MDANAIGVYQSNLYERGLHNFQLHTKEKLEEVGIENVETKHAIGVLHECGLHNLQSYAKAKLEEAGIKNVKTKDAFGVYQTHLYNQGLHPFQLHTMAKLEALGIENVDPNKANGVYKSLIMRSGNHPMKNPVTAAKSAKSRSKQWTDNQVMTLRKLVSEKNTCSRKRTRRRFAKKYGQGALGSEQGEDSQKSDGQGVLGSEQGEDAHSDAGEERTLGPESFSPSQNENANDRIQNRRVLEMPSLSLSTTKSNA